METSNLHDDPQRCQREVEIRPTVVQSALSGQKVSHAPDRRRLDGAVPSSLTVDHGTELTVLEEWAWRRGASDLHPKTTRNIQPDSRASRILAPVHGSSEVSLPPRRRQLSSGNPSPEAGLPMRTSNFMYLNNGGSPSRNPLTTLMTASRSGASHRTYIDHGYVKVGPI